MKSRHKLILHGQTRRSEPARDSGLSDSDDVEADDPIASRLTPTGICVGFSDVSEPVFMTLLFQSTL